MKTIKKSLELSAAQEMQVSYNPIVNTGIKISSQEKAYEFFMSIWSNAINIQEQIFALFLNQKLNLIGWKCVNTGTMSTVNIDMRLILTLALKCGAKSIIVGHNHPSGECQASNADVGIFTQLKKACNILDISLNDCLILSKGNGFSSIIDQLDNDLDNKKYNRELSKGQLELLDIGEPMNAGDVSDYLEEVFDMAIFHIREEFQIDAKAKSGLYFCKELYKTFRKIHLEYLQNDTQLEEKPF